jgi:membrane protein implicated in regulation of membrane protease activity
MDAWREWCRPELIWFFVGLLLLFIELVVPGLVIAFFAFGAWVVAGIQLFRPMTINEQLALFIASSVLSLILARSWLKGLFMGYVSSRQAPNTDLVDFVGERAVVTQKITPKLPGKVDLHGTPWLAAADAEIAEGSVVEVTAKDNLTLKVKLV